MNRRRILAGLLAAPLVIRIPGLIMPAHAVPDLRTVRVRSGETLARRTFGPGWKVIAEPGSRIERCHFVGGQVLECLPGGWISFADCSVS